MQTTANTPARQWPMAHPLRFDVRGRRRKDDQPVEYETEAPTACDAVSGAINKGLCSVVCRVHRPELTEEEGRARWPKPLHPQAFFDAWCGWHERDQQEQIDPRFAAAHYRDGRDLKGGAA